MTTTLLETGRIPPPPGNSTEELSVPLAFLDIQWLHCHLIRRLLFYNIPNCSKVYFLETLVPKLKESLSITLKHYLPVAGSLLYPPVPEINPVICYRAGDSVSLAIAESSIDFEELIGNHARDADQFYDFAPQMPPIEDYPDYKTVPLLALKVTLFPDQGICIGFTNHHCLGDAHSIVSFILTWAEISKLGGDEEILTRKGQSLPIFDRSVVKVPTGLDSIYWKAMRQIPLKLSSFPLPTNRVRATYILKRADIQKLKDLVLEKKPGLGHVSSYVVTVSYVWTCFVKSGDSVEDEIDEDVLEFFMIAADARARVHPPVPANYFGNCLGGGAVAFKHKELVGKEGFMIAAEKMTEVIRDKVNNNKQMFQNADENSVPDMEKSSQISYLAVSGSPKFDLTSADFGWGTAKKLEVLSIDEGKYTLSLCKSRDYEGGLEVGLSLPKKRMEAFASIFADGLRFP